ncbi:extracellular exonuclease ExeM [Shewanella gelidii]|uniref:Endonuclease n=1 Tax=Shewanella gelidii TaxID=1642821 RepID=A0A917JMU7_9GAMM|nr:extracellular exonuclease ExeM [Shewanella gelidii]MCL1097883.1 extracellular exonuclease ExeM [Shewanella gelidii]GGI77988.1 endonuclease [Shewanella gelidii]
MRNTNKLTAISLAVAAALPMMASADIIISEYVEGSGGNKKAIELYNSGTSSVDLTGYTLARHSNGAAAASVMISLDGQTIAPNATKVIVHNTTDIPVAAGVDYLTSTSMTFNGNDAVDLMNGTTVIDRVGVLSSSDFAKDVTLERKESVTMPSATWDQSQWTDKGENHLSGLGARIGDVAGGEEPEPEAFSCEGAQFTPIYDVQGAEEKSPLITDGFETENEYTVRGVVTARGESLFKGFYIQDMDGDGSPYTSDGIFVNLGAKAADDIQPGVEVCVQGKVKEFYNMTQIDISADNKVEVLGTGDVIEPTAFYVADDETFAQALERFEGMHILVDAGSDLKVSRTFSYDYDSRRNNMMLSYKAPLMKPTQVYAPLSDAAVALEAANRANQLFLESDYKAQNGEVPYMPTFNAEDGYIRVGDQLTNMTGVVSYSYGEYRLVATNEVVAGDFMRGEDRLSTPTIANEGDIRVASYNVLNLFTSDSDIGGDLNPSCSDQADADASRGCGRGAHTLDDYLLQRTKIVNALVEMNADIVGLMEIENNGFGEDSSIQYLVNALNAELPALDGYAFIEAADADKYKGMFIGGDAITVGILYRPNKVTPSGDAFVIATPEQHAAEGVSSRGEGDDMEMSPAYDKYQRHSLGQAFEINGEQLTVVVNHLKSKGSGCLEDWNQFAERDDPADLQGHCNAFRVSAAKVLGEALKGVEGDLLVLGDMNAYGMEDPIAVLTDYDATTANREIMTASWTTLDGKVYEREGSKIDKGYGLVNLNTQGHGPATYSYSYSGELGNLDHALANTTAAARLVAIEDWHINSVESSLFEYSGKYTGDLEKSENVFASSDHDPIIVALSYPEKVEPTPEPEPKKKSDGGSLSFIGLALLSILGLRRRMHS